MIQSMTGFGRAEAQIGNQIITVEIRSVNHRFLDLRFRLPPALSSHELSLSEIVRNRFERGSFDVNIKQKLGSSSASFAGSTRFVLDELAATSFLAAAKQLESKTPIPKESLAASLFANNKILVPIDETADGGMGLAEVRPVFERALDEIQKMRETEGGKLHQILNDGLRTLEQLTDKLTLLAPEVPKLAREKLTQRITKWQMNSPVDSNRLEWEVAFYADRSDISEEIDRLKTHIKAFHGILKEKKSVGRKCDFLTQEVHREINTVASKANWIEITQVTVEAKTVTEKLREQVQNVE